MRTAFRMLFLGAALIGCATQPSMKSVPTRPILIQGALQMEIGTLLKRLDGVQVETIGPWTFWHGTISGYPVIVSKTGMGTANAAGATAVAIQHYSPVAIINQGTSGGHDPGLRVYDVVIGTEAVSLGAFRTPYRAKGSGSNPVEWIPLDLRGSPGSVDGDLHENQIGRSRSDDGLLAAARAVKHLYERGRVVDGVIGSSDVWNEEIDRITAFRATHNTSVEEMETAPSAQVAALFKVPFLGIRVVSANVTSGGGYDAATAEACQDFVLRVVSAYVSSVIPSRTPAA